MIDSAVLTGDIVGSTELAAAARSRIGHRVLDAWQQARHFWSQGLNTPPDSFRGDGWQILIDSPVDALPISLFLRCTLLVPVPGQAELRTRVSLGLGTIDFRPTGNRVSGGGSAFHVSGRELDQLPSDRWFAIGVPEQSSSCLAAATRAIAVLLDYHVAAWTTNQCAAVAGRLTGLKQREIAAAWWNRPTSQQSVAKHLKSAGWDAIDGTATAFADMLR